MLPAAFALLGIVALFIILAATRPTYDNTPAAGRTGAASEDELRARGNDFEWFHDKYDEPAQINELQREAWNRRVGRTGWELKMDGEQ